MDWTTVPNGQARLATQVRSRGCEQCRFHLRQGCDHPPVPRESAQPAPETKKRLYGATYGSGVFFGFLPIYFKYKWNRNLYQTAPPTRDSI